MEHEGNVQLVKSALIGELHLGAGDLLVGSTVNDEGAVIKSMADGSEQTLEADTVVMAIGLRPRADMTGELAGSGIQVFSTGDGLQVGNIRTCVSGAYEIARSI